MGFVNRALGAILAIGLVVAGAVALFEIGAIVAGADPMIAAHDLWLADVSGRAWESREARLVFLGLIAAGLALIVLQLLRQRPAEVPAAEGAPLATRVPRHDLEREVGSDLLQVEGVATAAVRLRRRGFDVKASVIAGDPSTLREQLAVAARQALSARGADPSGPVKVDVRRQPARDS